MGPTAAVISGQRRKASF